MSVTIIRLKQLFGQPIFWVYIVFIVIALFGLTYDLLKILADDGGSTDVAFLLFLCIYLSAETIRNLYWPLSD